MIVGGVGKGDKALFGEAETDRAPVEEEVPDTPSSEPGEFDEILMIVEDFLCRKDGAWRG
jgi:hypothetical protein